MEVYFSKYEIVPPADKAGSSRIEGGYGLTWIKADDAQSADIKSRFLIERMKWSIKATAIPPTVVSRDHFRGRDLGLKKFDEASQSGYAIDISGWGKDFDPPREIPLPIDIALDPQSLWKKKALPRNLWVGSSEQIGADEVVV